MSSRSDDDAPGAGALGGRAGGAGALGGRAGGAGPMIVTVTDFGLAGPYLGQMRAVLHREAPGVPVIDLFADLPAFDPQAASYLLAAYAPAFPQGTVFVCVVDPGVGGARRALVVEADGRRFVGPDNGLLAIVARRAARAAAHEITWMPPQLSRSFHGRDLFAPVAGRLAHGEAPPGAPVPVAEIDRAEWPDDLPRIVYVDRYGNAMTGIRAETISGTATVTVGGEELMNAETFDAVPPSTAFWYENSNGLVEIAVNRGRADTELKLGVGSPVAVTDIG